MKPPGNRSRADELARALDNGFPRPSAATAGLAALAVRLRAMGPTLEHARTPRPEFRAALRQRLVAVATVQPAAAAVPAPSGRWTLTWSAQRRLGATAGAMAAIVAFTGVAIASSRALPGQPFYGLKRATESLQLDLAHGEAAKGAKHLEFAATRLREAQALAHGDSAVAVGSVGVLAAGLASGTSTQQRIVDTLHDFNSETTLGEGLLETAYRRTGRAATLQVLTTFTSQQKGRLTALVAELPATSAAAAQESLDLVTAVSRTADQLLALGTCTASCDPAGGGPSLPPAAVPSPGTSATSPEPADNGVPACSCAPAATPQASPEPTPSPSPSPTPSPSPSPTTAPTASPSPSASSGPLPSVLPSGLPTAVPTSLPTILPTLGPLPSLAP